MKRVTASGSVAALRRLAQLSILFAVVTLLATGWALLLLPDAGATGQWIVAAAGAAVGLSAFAFGVMISLRKPRARRAGFVVVAAAFLTAALFGLLAFVVPESALMFGAWFIVLVAYAAVTTHRLVRWPTGELSDEPKSSLGLFISYRREDSRETVGRIHDHLLQSFEEEHVFLDVDRQEAGEDYRVRIVRALDHADVLLAVIGRRWVAVTADAGRRRIDDPDDLVRIEIETALEQNVRVVPVLVEGAAMPGAADLPASLQPLRYRTAVSVRPDPDFKSDIQQLVRELREGQVSPADSAAASA